MDPFSIVTTCIGLIGNIAQLSAQIKTFVGHYRDARKDLESVSSELQSLSMCLECLRGDFSNERINPPEGISVSLSAVLGDCENVVADMQALLLRYSSTNFDKRLQWAVNGRQQMSTLRTSLELHKSTIDLALEITTV